MYRIISYDRVNGVKTNHKIFKRVFVENISDINDFEDKKRKEYFEKHGEECEIFANYKIEVKNHVPWK